MKPQHTQESLNKMLVNEILNEQKKEQVAPPKNYVDAFDPTNEMYSVNTGNASMRMIEDLRALNSPAPELPKGSDFSALAIGAAILFGFFIFSKKGF